MSDLRWFRLVESPTTLDHTVGHEPVAEDFGLAEKLFWGIVLMGLVLGSIVGHCWVSGGMG